MKELKGFKSSPLVSCIVEIRFKHNAGELVPGLVYSSISDRYNSPKVENLPILQLPQQVREQDPNLTYQPTNSIALKNLTMHIGPRVLSLNYDISSGKRYPGWEAFLGELKLLSKELGGISLFKNVERVGIRYVNFFQTTDFLSNLRLSLSTPWDKEVEDDLNFNFLLRNEGSKTRIVVSTNATLTTVRQGVQAEPRTGQILDLDTFIEKQVRFQDLVSTIDELHTAGKNAFITSFKDEFFESMGPDYA